MDTTPSLTRSSSSPSNSYCPSEVSSLEYPSPDLVAQQYRISSLYGVDPFCSMTQNQDADIPLFSLATVSQSSWSHTATSTSAPNTHVPSTSAALPTILSMEYDPFGGFGPAVSAVYVPGVYSAAPQTHRARQMAGSPSPVTATSRSPTMPISRSPLLFPATSASLVKSPMASRSGTETSMPSHSRTASASPFPPPTRALQFPYQLEPTGAYAPGSNASGSNGYLSDGTAVFWGQATASADQFYSAPGAHRQPSASSFPERHPRGSRPRRQPRRLTTKEEANFQCEVKGCGKLFSRSYNYKAHMETHDEKREYPFPCQVPDCGKRFVRKTDLQRHHQSVHMKERNHKCDYCGRLFARKDTLRRHMDDGCSKRFDIGTLDLRTEGASSTNNDAQGGTWRSR